MKVISPDEFDTGLYERIETSPDRVVLWRNPDTDVWWAVVTTSDHELGDGGPEAVVCAFALDKSERSDTAIIRWANSAAARGAHPEDETA